jgi:hypothetical protein
MSEHNNKPKYLRVAAGLLLIAGLVVAIGAATAILTSGTVTSDQPQNQTVEVDLEFIDGGTTADVELSRDGTVVQSETVTESTATTTTASLPLTGLAEGDFSLDVTGADESNVSVADTRMVTKQTEVLDVNENDSVAVDVGFDAQEVTNASVAITSDTGTTLRDETVSFDPIEFEGGTGYKTVEWTPSSNYENVTVTVETSPVYGHDAVYSVIDGDGGATGGVIGGAGRTEMIGFAIIVVGLVVAVSRDQL